MTEDSRLLNEAIEDPTLRELVRLSEATFTGHSDDGTARATADGTQSIRSIEVGESVTDPGFAGASISQAINAALVAAQRGVTAALQNNEAIPAELRRIMAEAPGSELDVDPAQSISAPEGVFEGEGAGGCVVRVDARSQQVVSVYVTSLDADALAGLPDAANRALAAAQLGREGATPIADEIDGHLATLDAKLEAVTAKLDGVDNQLDAILRSLG